MLKKISIEFSLGIVVALALYFLDKSGRNNAALSVILLTVLAGLLLHPALQVPWIWSSPDLAVRVWKVALATCFVILLVSGFGIWTWPKSAEGAKTAPEDELFATVLSFSVSETQDHLTATVAFRNAGKSRRTILNVNICYREEKNKIGHGLLANARDPLRSYDSPIYVEPQSEIIHTYTQAIDPGLLKLLLENDFIFGLIVSSLNRDSGITNRSVIEIGDIRLFHRLVTDDVSPVSLDKKVATGEVSWAWESTTQPSPTPNMEASPH